MPGCTVGGCGSAGWHDDGMSVGSTTVHVCCSVIFQTSSTPGLSLPCSSSYMQRTVVVRTQCRAVVVSPAANEPAQQCEQITRRGFYCADHANELLGLEVKTSLLLGEPGEAGLGLFTTRDREAWSIVDEYLGEVVANDVFTTQCSPFGVAISLGRIINSTRSSDCFARFANDARGTAAVNNCWLVSDRQFGLNWAQPRYTNGSGGRVWLITNCAVQAGNELLVNYGTTYWSVPSLA